MTLTQVLRSVIVLILCLMTSCATPHVKNEGVAVIMYDAGLNLFMIDCERSDPSFCSLNDQIIHDEMRRRQKDCSPGTWFQWDRGKSGRDSFECVPNSQLMDSAVIEDGNPIVFTREVICDASKELPWYCDPGEKFSLHLKKK